MILALLLLSAIIISCGEDSEVNEPQGKDSNAEQFGGYSGITEVSENIDDGIIFKSIDPDDWRDDGILSSCIVYPNPIIVSKENFFLKCRYKLMSQAHVVMIMRDHYGNIYRRGSLQEIYPYTIWDSFKGYPSGVTVSQQRPGMYKADIVLSCQYEECFKLPESGIYRLFIYASENEFILQMLRDTGTFNASREDYSMVYGDISIINH